MTNKATKRALLTSVFSLLLCFVMLIGTTFAWFTDTVTSTRNVIQSGNLDVELYYKNSETSNWTLVDENTNVFKDDTLWEPGHAEVVMLKVANEGSLALKYQLGVKVFSETGSVNVNDVAFKLSDYIMFGFAEGEVNSSREAAISAVEAGATALNTAYETTEILINSGDEKIVTMVVYMPETVGNEANYGKNQVVPELNLGINVFATQKDSEEDSFGPDYDEELDASTNGVSQVVADGSTVFYYNEESGFGDRIRLKSVPENLGSEYVVPAEVNDLGGALVGKTLDKVTLPVELDYASKSLENATIEEVVIPEGTEKIPNRLFYKANVETVVIPSTVTTIEPSAFQQSNIKELVIPASVEIIGDTAFGASKFEKVTFEGSVTMDNKAFRGATALRTVYIDGEDIELINTTGNAGCWFCNSESNNPGTSDITFYVKNETVAAKIKTAMGAECPADTSKSKVKIYVNGNPYYIGTKQ